MFIADINGAISSSSLTVFVFVHGVANIVQRYDPLLTGEATAEVDQLTVVTQASATASSFMVATTRISIVVTLLLFYYVVVINNHFTFYLEVQSRS